MDYKTLLERSYEIVKTQGGCPPESRLEFLADDLFDFTTYDSEMGKLFGRKAIEVCAAITNRKTFEYIENPKDYKWFLLMCNMPFFSNKLEWGTSIRGAWWGTWPVGALFTVNGRGLYDEDAIVTDAPDRAFTLDQWKEFMLALIEFAAPEMNLPHADDEYLQDV